MFVIRSVLLHAERNIKGVSGEEPSSVENLCRTVYNELLLWSNVDHLDERAAFIVLPTSVAAANQSFNGQCVSVNSNLLPQGRQLSVDSEGVYCEGEQIIAGDVCDAGDGEIYVAARSLFMLPFKPDVSMTDFEAALAAGGRCAVSLLPVRSRQLAPVFSGEGFMNLLTQGLTSTECFSLERSGVFPANDGVEEIGYGASDFLCEMSTLPSACTAVFPGDPLLYEDISSDEEGEDGEEVQSFPYCDSDDWAFLQLITK
jgi:hypothetical protein